MGPGFLEKVYENALMIRLRSGLVGFNKFRMCLFSWICVGEYSADILVEDTVIVEVKALSEDGKSA